MGSSGWSNPANSPDAFNAGPSMFGQLGGSPASSSFASGSANAAAMPNNIRKPDLSAFDNLLPMKSKSPVSMNAMLPTNTGLQPTQPRGTPKTPVKSLTTNDINDLLG